MTDALLQHEELSLTTQNGPDSLIWYHRFALHYTHNPDLKPC